MYRDGPGSRRKVNLDPKHINDSWYSDFDGDAQADLASDSPAKMNPNASPLRPGRKAVSDATRFFRRFDQSLLRPMIVQLGKDGRERADLLYQAVQALGGGLPDKNSMDQAGNLLKMSGIKAGSGFDPNAYANLIGASRYWHKVPEALTYLVRRKGEPIVVPSDEPEFNCKLGSASILDLPREMFWMDDELFYEAYARNALTKFDWDKRIWEPTHVKVTFIVDVSGSMNGAPMHIATACALKLGQIAEENGHEVSVVFFATSVSKEYSPTEAFGLKGLSKLGGGTNIMGAIKKVYESKPDAYVICSDFEVTPPDPWSMEALKTSQVFGILPVMSFNEGRTGPVELLEAWVPEAHRRIKIKISDD